MPPRPPSSVLNFSNQEDFKFLKNITNVRSEHLVLSSEHHLYVCGNTLLYRHAALLIFLNISLAIQSYKIMKGCFCCIVLKSALLMLPSGFFSFSEWMFMKLSSFRPRTQRPKANYFYSIASITRQWQFEHVNQAET